jgi:hypothetical protein
MADIAQQLRAQIPSSTDPHRLERLAREAEDRASLQDVKYVAHVAITVFQHVEPPLRCLPLPRAKFPHN